MFKTLPLHIYVIYRLTEFSSLLLNDIGREYETTYHLGDNYFLSYSPKYNNVSIRQFKFINGRKIPTWTGLSLNTVEFSNLCDLFVPYILKIFKMCNYEACKCYMAGNVEVYLSCKFCNPAYGTDESN